MGILNQVITGRCIGPPRVVLYSEPKAGKTTLMASIPDLVMIPLEDGQGTLDYARVPQQTSWEMLIGTLQELRDTEHPYKAVGIDCLSGVEEMLWTKICAEVYDDSWEKFHNYAKGPRHCAAYWVDLCLLFDEIRRKGVSIWCAAHAKLETVDDVQVGAYTRITPAIDKHGMKVLQAWADIIGHIQIERYQSEKGAKGKENKKTNTARSTNVRQLIVEDTGSHMAGNRFGLASPIEIPLDNPYGTLREALVSAIKGEPAQEAA